MTAVADPALAFWLRHVAAVGGLSEPDGDATYVVHPRSLVLLVARLASDTAAAALLAPG